MDSIEELQSVEELGVRNDMNKRYLGANKPVLHKVDHPKHMHINIERPEEHSEESLDPIRKTGCICRMLVH